MEGLKEKKNKKRQRVLSSLLGQALAGEPEAGIIIIARSARGIVSYNNSVIPYSTAPPHLFLRFASLLERPVGKNGRAGIEGCWP